MANAAARIGNIASVAWNDVEMKLGYGLAGGGAVVETEVKGVRRRCEGGAEVFLSPINPHQEAVIGPHKLFHI